MAIYTYKGFNRSGAEVKSTVNAENLSQAKHKIRTLGVMLIDIKEQKSGSNANKMSFSFGGKVSIEDLSLMTRQLATLVKAKIQIVEALTALMEQTDNQVLRVVLSEVRGKVNEGIGLAQAFKDYPKIFNNVYVNMVEAGEQSGTLEIVLLRLAEFTEAQKELKNKIRGAMTYPCIMVFVGLVMFSIIFTVVIPKITKIFVNMKRQVPLSTQICMWTSDFLLNYWYLLIIGMIASWLLFRSYIRTEKGRSRWHFVLLRLPEIGSLITMINVSRFCSTLATLLNSGVPILTSMRIVKNLVANVHMQAPVEEAKSNVQEGASLALPLENSGYYPPMVTHMIRLGEKSGELEEMLQIVAKNYEGQVNTKLAGLTSFIEPIMMVVMGLAVGFVVFSVVIPMMELNSFTR